MTLINMNETYGGVSVRFLILLFDGECLSSGGRHVEVTPGSSDRFRECV